jgi:hypothetical protein
VLAQCAEQHVVDGEDRERDREHDEKPVARVAPEAQEEQGDRQRGDRIASCEELERQRRPPCAS